jgi:hypothetical protein
LLLLLLTLVLGAAAATAAVVKEIYLVILGASLAHPLFSSPAAIVHTAFFCFGLKNDNGNSYYFVSPKNQHEQTAKKKKVKEQGDSGRLFANPHYGHKSEGALIAAAILTNSIYFQQ